MTQQWPTGVPTVDPTVHDEVAQQAYLAGGGDYFRSGYFYAGGIEPAPAGGGAGSGTNTLSFSPFWVPVRRAFDRIGVNVTTAATAASGGVVRLGLYAHGTGGPGVLIVDAGTVSSESTGAKEATISQTLDPGLYWLAAVAQVAACSWETNGTSQTLFVPLGSTASAAATRCLQTGVSGALPNPATPIYNSGTHVAIRMRAA